MRVEIIEQAFDPWRRLSEYSPQAAHSTTPVESVGQFGATAVFVGTLRRFNQGDEVKAMHLEHYPQMTSAHLERIVARALQAHAIGDALVIHRIGEILPGEAIVLVAVWAAHRRDAYAANRDIMEQLKSTAPFWKREHLDEGVRWIGENTPG